MARAEERANQEPEPSVGEETMDEAMATLAIWMYAHELKLSMGVMPDGMALWVRLGFPKASTDERAGMVSFLVSDQLETVLRKSLASLEASAKSNYWKPDQYAR
jgi:hypothetical protein